MPGIGVILNPKSKKYKNNPEKVKKMGFIVGDKASCHTTENLEDLRLVAEEFKKRDVDILAISGGDGTLHCTLTEFIHVYGDKPLPKIAFLRGGTLNSVAGSLKVRGSTEKILSSILVKYHEDIPFETKTVNLMKINDQYGFIFGLGVIYRFMEEYYGHGEVSPLVAATTLFKSIGSAIVNGPFASRMFERFDAEVIVNGKKWPFANYSALYTGTINQLGLNFRVFYLVDQFPDIFHAVGFAIPPRNVLRHVPMMYLGKPCGSPDLVEEGAKELFFKPEKPMPYTIDGDMKPPAESFHITLGPKLTILMP